MGKFIVIEGLDGAGKSTQIKLLLDYLHNEGVETKFVHFPTTEKGGLYGDLISRFLRGEFGPIDAVHPQLVALIFALDRQDFASTIKSWLDSDYTVIADRYVLSNVAFQCAKMTTKEEKEHLANWIYNYEFEYNKIPKPDLSIYLDVPISFIKQSLTQNRKGKAREYLNGVTDIHEDSILFQENVKKEYENILEKFSYFIKLKCSDIKGEILDAKVIHSKIVEILHDHISLPLNHQ